jgi:hypothetical protein
MHLTKATISNTTAQTMPVTHHKLNQHFRKYNNQQDNNTKTGKSMNNMDKTTFTQNQTTTNT